MISAGCEWKKQTMILGVKRTLISVFALLWLIAVPADAWGASPHGSYTSSTTLCEVCHVSHEATSTASQHTERLARLEEGNADLTYTGSWTTAAGGSRSGGASKESSQTGAIARLDFHGGRVAWIATKTSASGQARVRLDGVTQSDVDLYSVVDDFAAVAWRSTGLSAATHTIEVQVLGTKNPLSSGFDVDVDAIDLRVPKVMLLRGQSEKTVCYTCHAGTGSIYNVAEEFGETTSTSPPVSSHPVPEGTTLCSDCHTPHAAAENWDATPDQNEVVRLLRSIYSTFLGFVVSTANNWLDTPEPANVSLGLPEQRKFVNPYEQCGSCHGAGSTLPGGDELKYYDYAGAKHDGTASVSPDSKAGIACLTCHDWHVSSLPKLLETTIAGNPITANDNNVCYSCHVEPKIASFDTSPGDVHGATDSTKTPGSPGLVAPYDYRSAPIKCTICHNPHGSGNVDWTPTSINATSGISVDGTAAANRGQWEGYCAACHTYTHDTTATYDLCVTCHFHGAGNDASATTQF